MTEKAAIAPISVVIPCFNCAQTLERALLSIAAQTIRPAEIILVDDASTDSTGQVIERLRDRYSHGWIRTVTLKVNAGPATARNAGWEAALQPLLAFLDADDAWHPYKIEMQWAFMNTHPDVELCGHKFYEHAADQATVNTSQPRSHQIITCAKLLISNRIATRTVMLKRSAGYRFKGGKRYAEDYLLWLQIACDGKKVALLDAPLAYAYKAAYGAAGLSAKLWEMEKGEIETYSILVRERGFSRLLLLGLSIFSYVKYLRRLILVWRQQRRVII